jgi:hypothetical protein
MNVVLLIAIGVAFELWRQRMVRDGRTPRLPEGTLITRDPDLSLRYAASLATQCNKNRHIVQESRDTRDMEESRRYREHIARCARKSQHHFE